MPIEILPEGEPDWIEYSTTPDLKFLGIDPYWKAKQGTTDPAFAILYRGGANRLDRSVNGGRAWSSILGSITTPPPFYRIEDMEWFTSTPPAPRPAILTGPIASQLTFEHYSGNPSNSGEHAVLCSYETADGNVISPSDDVVPLHTMWILYTVDDWSTHGWTQILENVGWNDRDITQGSWLEAHYLGTSSYVFRDIVRINATDCVAISERETSANVFTVNVVKLRLAGGVFSVLGQASQANTFPYGPVYYYDGDIYFSRVFPVSDASAPYEFYFEVDSWDVSGDTPSYNGRDTSSVLTDSTTDSGTKFASGQSFGLTDAGKLLLQYGLTGGGDTQFTYLTFDTTTSIFGTPDVFYLGLSADVPLGISLACANLGGDKVIVSVLEEHAGSGAGDFYGYAFVMTAGTWVVPDTGQKWLEALSASAQHGLEMGRGCKLWSDDRFGWVVYTNPAGPNWRWRYAYYDDVLDTVTLIPYGGGIGDNGEASNGGRAFQADSVDDFAFAGNEIMWSDPDDFEYKAVVQSATLTSPYCAMAGDFTEYACGRVRQFTGGSGFGYYVEISLGEVGPKYSDYFFNRRAIGPMAWTLDGEKLYIPLKEMYNWADVGSGYRWETHADRLERKGDGSVDYDTGFAGLLWISWESDGVYDSDVPDNYYLGCRAWPKYTNGVIFFGKIYGISSPAWPHQIWGYSISNGWADIWNADSFTEPVRGVVYTNGKLYAVTMGASFGKFYGETPGADETGGDDMAYIADVTILDDPGLACIDADDNDYSIAIAGRVADLVMVVLSAAPYTSWSNITFSHKNDRGVTGLIVLD